MIRRLPDDLVIRQATPADIPSIVRLEMENQRDQGGQLSGFFPEHLLNQLMDSMPLMVAIQENAVVGFLLTSSAIRIRASQFSSKNDFALLDHIGGECSNANQS